MGRVTIQKPKFISRDDLWDLIFDDDGQINALLVSNDELRQLRSILNGMDL